MRCRDPDRFPSRKVFRKPADVGRASFCILKFLGCRGYELGPRGGVLRESWVLIVADSEEGADCGGPREPETPIPTGAFAAASRALRRPGEGAGARGGGGLPRSVVTRFPETQYLAHGGGGQPSFPPHSPQKLTVGGF